MREELSRTGLLLGEQAMERLGRARVALFGVGGVGGYALEALARSGIGQLDLIDNDCFSRSNLNRQILATQSTVGRSKVEVAKERVLQINPQAIVRTYPIFYTPETADQLDFTCFSYVIDAIDTVSGKLSLIERAYRAGPPVISCMGTGNKLDPTAFRVSDLSKTSMDPLARVMRRELRSLGIRHLKVLFSPEEPAPTTQLEAPPPGRRSVPASVPWVPSCAGLMMAGAVVQDLVAEGEVQP